MCRTVVECFQLSKLIVIATWSRKVTMAANAQVTRLLLIDNIRHRLVTKGLSIAGLEDDLSPLPGLGMTACLFYVT